MIPAKVASFIALNSNSVSFFFQRVFVEGRLHNRFFTLREMGLNKTHRFKDSQVWPNTYNSLKCPPEICLMRIF